MSRRAENLLIEERPIKESIPMRMTTKMVSMSEKPSSALILFTLHSPCEARFHHRRCEQHLPEQSGPLRVPPLREHQHERLWAVSHDRTLRQQLKRVAPEVQSPPEPTLRIRRLDRGPRPLRGRPVGL